MRISAVLTTTVLALAAPAVPRSAQAMCGCMMAVRPPRPPQQPQQVVAQKILNKASKVALVRDGDLTILTMSNDVITDADELGLVVPVPTVIKQADVRVVDPAVFSALETLTNPRVERVQDPEPCPELDVASAAGGGMAAREAAPSAPRAKRVTAADYGVRVDAHYDVGEYSIAVLSAKEGAGAGLMEWLNKFHYDVPAAAVPVLDSYIKQGLRFFVAKVNFKKLERRQGSTFLRPIQVRYSTPRFMLPVRLGTINADGPQELVAWGLSPRGKVEATNYRTQKMVTGVDLPLYVQGELEQTYAAIFDRATKQEEMRAIFVEYVARGALDAHLGAQLGLGWGGGRSGANPGGYTLTRLHFRYDRETFPEDLMLQETGDATPHQVRFTVRVPASNTGCPEGQTYLASLPARREREAQTLASLTGQDIGQIRGRMGLHAPVEEERPTPTERAQPQQAQPRPDAGSKEPFWKRLWRP